MNSAHKEISKEKSRENMSLLREKTPLLRENTSLLRHCFFVLSKTSLL